MRLVLSILLVAAAQQRGAEPPPQTLELSLQSPARFGEITVPAGTYAVSLTEAGLVLSNKSSMVPVATLAVAKRSDGKAVSGPVVLVRRAGPDLAPGELEVSLRTQDQIYVVRGRDAAAAKEASRVQLEKTEAEVQAAGTDPTDEALLDGALKRYAGEISECADKAQRGRWVTDDPRFKKCVCPILERWRLPKIHASVRLHRPLAKGKSGYSLTALPEGKAQDCRVWVGPRSPEEPVPKKP